MGNVSVDADVDYIECCVCGRNNGLEKTDDNVFYGYCPEHGNLSENGLVALVEISNIAEEDQDLKMHPSEVNKTGRVCIMPETLFNECVGNDVLGKEHIYLDIKLFQLIVDASEHVDDSDTSTSRTLH